MTKEVGQLGSAGAAGNPLASSIKGIRERAKAHRKAGGRYFGAAVGVVLVSAAVIFFLFVRTTPGDDAAQPLKDILTTLNNLVETTDKLAKHHYELEEAEGTPPSELRHAINQVASTMASFSSNVSNFVAAGLAPHLIALASVTLPRAAILLLALYLSQLLFSTFRYHRLMASHLDARGDALEIADNVRGEGIEILVRILSPDSVGFGAKAKAPTQELVELVRAIIEASKPTAK